ncbi:hypothetical protein LCY76_03135 [Fictibacillus sp. KIGAM418]|uniref:Uncharacterized protein n=1 Tax=Fictibacillus marinisediminis TaxID=2878389 RepID=A0A9X1X837_9BACL|nr:hypothetical protein [Fictibacillus marinisediminis]MCK6255618.1 hypothetical protein [Fictibacillus marinisediminis]
MRESFHKLFWGFLLILIEIHIIAIDILPDPIGYYMVFSGLSLLKLKSPAILKAKYLALGLVFISIPTVFIQQNSVNGSTSGHIFDLSLWPIYTQVIGIIKLILVFYVFQILLDIAMKKGDQQLYATARYRFISYMAVMLIFNITLPFTMNIVGDLVTAYTVAFLLLSLLVEVMFLLLLRKYGKVLAVE